MREEQKVGSKEEARETRCEWRGKKRDNEEVREGWNLNKKNRIIKRKDREGVKREGRRDSGWMRERQDVKRGRGVRAA